MIVRISDDSAVLLCGCCNIYSEQSYPFMVCADWGMDGVGIPLYQPNAHYPDLAKANSAKVLEQLLFALIQDKPSFDVRSFAETLRDTPEAL